MITQHLMHPKVWCMVSIFGVPPSMVVFCMTPRFQFRYLQCNPSQNKNNCYIIIVIITIISRDFLIICNGSVLNVACWITLFRNRSSETGKRRSWWKIFRSSLAFSIWELTPICGWSIGHFRQCSREERKTTIKFVGPFIITKSILEIIRLLQVWQGRQRWDIWDLMLCWRQSSFQLKLHHSF